MNETKIAFKAVTKTILKTKLTESKSIQSVIHYITAFLAICVAPLVLLTACGNDDPADLDDKITFATSSMYPPFEFHAQGELQGLDIDIAKAVAKELGREAIFEDMQFGAVLAAIQSGQADAGIATMTITDERKQCFDFSEPFYFETMAAVFDVLMPINEIADMDGKRIVCQLGTTMEFWLKQQHFVSAEIVTMDSPNQAIEAVKSGQADVAFLDGAQSAIFSQNNPELAYKTLITSKDGYGIVVRKGSDLLEQINSALATLEGKGELNKIKTKWLGDE